jgi:hypothetical protein
MFSDARAERLRPATAVSKAAGSAAGFVLASEQQGSRNHCAVAPAIVERAHVLAAQHAEGVLMVENVFIGSAFVAKYPNGGGNYWVPLQYVLGFRELAVEAFWIEILESTGRPEVDEQFIAQFMANATACGVQDRVVLVFFPSGIQQPDHRIVYGMPAQELDTRMRDGVLLNMVGSLQPAQRAPFRRTVLFDLDPGPFQIWASQWDMGVGSHDRYITIGQNLGAADSPVPLFGVEWQRTWPAVHLASWAAQTGPGTAYTTITHWWSEEAAYLGDLCFDCNKRNGFIDFVDLPRHTAVTLELAASVHPAEREDIELFTGRGWRLVAPDARAATPDQFRDYIQGSRGEFSCAKPAYVTARSGWISDRSVCYLASARPCVLQDTGAAGLLPRSRGLRVFTSIPEAAEALAETEKDYAAAAREARQLACDVFSTRVVLPRLLSLCGL